MDSTKRRFMTQLVNTSWVSFPQNVFATSRAKNGEVAADDSEIRSDDHNLCIGGFLDLETLLSTMSKRRAVFVIRESDATEHGYHAWNYGLLTISDLNRHGLRGALYRLFSEVESGLAKLIETSLGEPWEWIRVLTESHQVGILGYWELSKRKGIDIGPIAATTSAAGRCEKQGIAVDLGLQLS